MKMAFQYKVSSYLFKITFEKEISLFFTQIPFAIVYSFYPLKLFSLSMYVCIIWNISINYTRNSTCEKITKVTDFLDFYRVVVIFIGNRMSEV